jgi:hypothetical protein
MISKTISSLFLKYSYTVPLPMSADFATSEMVRFLMPFSSKISLHAKAISFLFCILSTIIDINSPINYK